MLVSCIRKREYIENSSGSLQWSSQLGALDNGAIAAHCSILKTLSWPSLFLARSKSLTTYLTASFSVFPGKPQTMTFFALFPIPACGPFPSNAPRATASWRPLAPLPLGNAASRSSNTAGLAFRKVFAMDMFSNNRKFSLRKSGRFRVTKAFPVGLKREYIRATVNSSSKHRTWTRKNKSHSLAHLAV